MTITLNTSSANLNGNSRICLNTNWTTRDDATKKVVEKAKTLLDGRIKAVKDASDSTLNRIVTSFLATATMSTKCFWIRFLTLTESY